MCRKGDYLRYMAEFNTENEDFSAKSLASYKLATDIAQDKDGLAPTHPIRLGLLLNFTVFFYEILGEKSKALLMAESGFEEAISLMDSMPDENYKDTVLLMQLLRDNLTIWKGVEQVDEEQKALDGKCDNSTRGGKFTYWSLGVWLPTKSHYQSLGGVCGFPLPFSLHMKP